MKLIIIGTSSFAEIAYEYFSHDSSYEVVAFVVHEKYLEKSEKFGLPIVAIEEMQNEFSTDDHSVFVAVPYPKLNRLRKKLLDEVKQKGYKVASYVSSQAFVWKNVKVGENCFVFENNVIQPFVTIGDNVILWSGNHIGHHSSIGDHCFVSSHAVVCGHVKIGKNCFLGANSTISNDVTIADDNWLGPNTLITRDTEKGQYFRIKRDKPDDRKNAYEINGIEPDA